MVHCLFSLSVLAASLAATAAGQIILPAKAADREGGWDDLGTTPVFSSVPAQPRTQMLYSVDDIKVASASLQRVAFRHSHLSSTPGGSWTARIELSSGPLPPENAQATFANNHGADRRVVFDGFFSLPARGLSEWPQQWEAPIPFSQPFVFAKGIGVHSLVLDVTVISGSVLMEWDAETCGVENGWATTVFQQSGCVSYGGVKTGYVVTGNSELRPGGTIDFYMELGMAQPSMAANVLVLSGGGPGTNVFGLTTPFLLTDLGLPAAPSCQWAIGYVDWTTVLTYRTSPYPQLVTSPPIAIPNDARVTGVQLYTQALALDRASNMPDRLFSTVALRWLIGPGTVVPASVVIGWFPKNGPPPDTGLAWQSRGVSVSFNQ